ncbi:MAG TPA: hypothetical protein VJ673_11455 [Aromatoleum sp.]|uniref:hypothetical protein n=1 Tax=Aromatoleum sp. TaxID=2307007 RepID=UPI002B478DEF|nr:hypothetical protein [Aromatoleum sp.]HJV26298.1 hypothetical protein [Aromatoleum sp.]
MTATTADRHEILINLGSTPAFTVSSTDPLVVWLREAEAWPTYTPAIQRALRPLVLEAVQHLYREFVSSFEPWRLGIWYEEDAYRTNPHELCQQVGGALREGASWPYMAVLAAIGVSDEESADLMAPILERNLLAAYGGC